MKDNKDSLAQLEDVSTPDVSLLDMSQLPPT